MKVKAPRAWRAVACLSVLLLGLGPTRADDVFREPPDHPVTVDHLALDLDVDLAGRAVRGTATLDLRALRDVRRVRLDAVALQVSSVKIGDTPATSFENDGKSLTFDLTLARDEHARVTIAYASIEPKSGLWFFGPTKAEPNVPLQVWSQGEGEENRYWFPCLDHPSIRQSTEITVRVPTGFTALSNGALVSEKKDEARGTTEFHWAQAKSHVSYLVTLVVGKFHVAREEWHGKPVLYYVPEARKDDVERSFGRTRAMLDFFSEKIGVEYPWEKYAQVVVEQFIAGGMENTSATTLFDGGLLDERAAIDFDADWLVAHELAHQWWGDLVACHDWVHIWLNEGFATYFQKLWIEKSLGRDEFDYDMLLTGNQAREEGKQNAVVNHRGPEAGIYPKGAWVLHQLRRRLGDDAFWRSIRRYVKENAYKTAETVDLRRAFEAETGESLERTFFELSERPGSPALDVTFVWREQEKLLEVRVKQTQSVEPFAIKSSIAFGEKPAEAKRVAFIMDQKDERERRVLIPLAARPSFVRFDPDESVLEDLVEHKGDDQWLCQLSSDPSVVGRIRAAQALAETRTPASIDAVAHALASDPFWGVSVECAKALARAGGDKARDALVAALASPHPKIRAAAASGLGSFRKDERVLAALRAKLEKGDASYAVEAQLGLAYAKACGPDARDWLEKAIAKPSHREVIRNEAIRGLEALEDPTVLPLLERLAKSPGDARMRANALSALGRVASLPSASVEARAAAATTLVGALESRMSRLQGAAADALGAIGRDAASGLSGLDDVAVHALDPGVRDRAKQAIERIRAGLPADRELSRLRDEMRRLKEDEGKLIERLERLESRAGASPSRSDQGPW